MAVDNHSRGAFEDEEQFMHVGMRVGGQDFARRNNDACDLGERRQVAFAESDLLLRRRIVTDRFFRRAVDGIKFHCF